MKSQTITNPVPSTPKDLCVGEIQPDFTDYKIPKKTNQTIPPNKFFTKHPAPPKATPNPITPANKKISVKRARVAEEEPKGLGLVIYR